MQGGFVARRRVGRKDPEGLIVACLFFWHPFLHVHWQSSGWQRLTSSGMLTSAFAQGGEQVVSCQSSAVMLTHVQPLAMCLLMYASGTSSFIAIEYTSPLLAALCLPTPVFTLTTTFVSEELRTALAPPLLLLCLHHPPPLLPQCSCHVCMQVLQLVGDNVALQQQADAAAVWVHPQPHACLLLQVLLESHLHQGPARDQAQALALALAKGTHPNAWQLLKVMEEWAAACAAAR